MPCMLDYLPWEILHTTFDYLKAIDLLHAFVGINSYLDTILHSYSRIQLNFKSVKKRTFSYICERIHPGQVQSLVLSNDEYTPGQIQLFLSLLPLIQFINLQYLSIDQIDHINSLCLILSYLENHVQICSLSVTGSQMLISKRNACSITEILISLPSLKYLTFMNSSTLITLRQSLTKLTHLTINSCALNDLPVLFHWVPNLVYLNVSVPMNDRTSRFDYVPIHLSTLIITSRSWTLFEQLENLLSLTPSLKRLILEIMGEQALLDGRRWETLIKRKLSYLTELALNITPEENNLSGDDVLIPFHNSFWTNEKNWHMACFISTVTQSCARLFSVPHFTPTDDWYPLSDAFVNYSLTPYSFYDDYVELRVVDFPEELLISMPLKKIQTLSFQCPTDNIDQLQKVVNLISVNHLKFVHSVRCTVFNDLLQAGPNINQLTMSNKTLVQILDSFSNNENVYDQIKKLNINDPVLDKDINRIFRMFPKVEHVSLSVKDRDDIFPIFNQFTYLTSATVRWTYPFKTSPDIIDKYLEERNICTDGTYQFHLSTLYVWID